MNLVTYGVSNKGLVCQLFKNGEAEIRFIKRLHKELGRKNNTGK
jgi:hypothetical protein